MKTAIVTGGTSGIGLAIVKMLAAKGYRVLATYSSNDMEEEIANVETCRADQSDKESMRAFVAWVKQTAERVDCIVLNAGITLRKGLTDFSDEEWERVVHGRASAWHVSRLWSDKKCCPRTLTQPCQIFRRHRHYSQHHRPRICGDTLASKQTASYKRQHLQQDGHTQICHSGRDC